jgi:hypothetical protein
MLSSRDSRSLRVQLPRARTRTSPDHLGSDRDQDDQDDRQLRGGPVFLQLGAPRPPMLLLWLQAVARRARTTSGIARHVVSMWSAGRPSGRPGQVPADDLDLVPPEAPPRPRASESRASGCSWEPLAATATPSDRLVRRRRSPSDRDRSYAHMWLHEVSLAGMCSHVWLHAT